VFDLRQNYFSKIIMPTSLIHRIGIAEPAETIYRALTTGEASARGGRRM